MKFVHYSARKLGPFEFESDLRVHFKPHHVLWVAKDEQWKNYIVNELENPKWFKSYKYKYTFDIDMKKVIELATYKDVQKFTQEFEAGRELIDWNKVRRETGKCGIYVKNPLTFRIRMDFGWFGSFDVESIGIWDNTCIRSGTEEKL